MFHILGRFVFTSSFSRRSSPGFRMGPTRFGFCCCERGLLIVFTISIPSIRALELSSSIFSLFGGLPTVTDTLASTSRGMSSNCVWALARREDGGYQSQVLAQPGSASTKPTTIQRSPARCSGNKPWTCGCCVRCLPILVDIRSRDDASLVRSGASFVDLRRLGDFRPFPKSAHLGVHRFTHDSIPLQISSLECLIGRECHDHQDDKNGNDEGWNKLGSHCAFPSPGCGV